MNDQFPRGKLNDEDEGALNIRLTVKDKTMIIAFAKPVEWIGLDKATALAFADTIRKRAEEL